MPKIIQDEFAGVKMSRQRRYQLRKRRDGLCVECGKKAVSPLFCRYHYRKSYANQHRLNKSKREYNSKWSKLRY